VATPPVGYGLGDKRLGGVDGSPRSGGRPRRPPRPSLPETRSAVAQTAAQWRRPSMGKRACCRLDQAARCPTESQSLRRRGTPAAGPSRPRRANDSTDWGTDTGRPPNQRPLSTASSGMDGWRSAAAGANSYESTHCASAGRRIEACSSDAGVVVVAVPL